MTVNRLDHAGIAKVLKVDMRGPVRRVAEEIASRVNSLGIGVGDKDGGPAEYDLPVKVQLYTTDRAAASVTLAHPAGLAVEAKHGALRKAAASVGLDVKAKG